MVHATGAGAASRQAMGTAVFYGMIGSTNLGLVFTAVLCVAITAISERIRKPKNAESHTPTHGLPVLAGVDLPITEVPHRG
jgi:HAE1 family hydrophobic/amphiphilic exporter-1